MQSANPMTKAPDELNFDNTYQQLPPLFYSHVPLTPLQQPHLISFNEDVGKLIDIDETTFNAHHYIDYFNGTRTFVHSKPIATVYAGHQFGVFVPQLGDGRAILLGEIRNRQNQKWDVQVKGGGSTPYSRMADGRAVLRSTIREYLCSEAMHALGIPTTRGLCVIGSNESVYRETQETGALLVRVAKTHIRIGHFEFFYYRNQHDHLKTLLNYVIHHYYPEYEDKEDGIALFFSEFVKRTATLMAQWQAAGFTHGVMNSDNFSIIGDTIDYGPFGFMESYDINFVPNHSDYNERYSYEQQPHIGQWNCACLAQTLTPFLSTDTLTQIVDSFDAHFIKAYSTLLLNKIGFEQFIPDDQALLDDMFKLMMNEKTDYAIFYRALSHFTVDGENTHLRDLFVNREQWGAWATRYNARLKQEPESDSARMQRMLKANPKYILRKHLAQTAIGKAEQGDFSEVNRLLVLLKHPFDEQPDMQAYANHPPDWAASIHLSCSS